MDEYISLRIPKAMRAELSSLAAPRLLRPSDIVREAVLEYLAKRRAESAQTRAVDSFPTDREGTVSS